MNPPVSPDIPEVCSPGASSPSDTASTKSVSPPPPYAMLHISGGLRIGSMRSNNVINIGGQRIAEPNAPNSVGAFAKAVEQQGATTMSDSSSNNVIQIGSYRLPERKSAPVSTPTHTPDTADEVVQQPQPGVTACLQTKVEHLVKQLSVRVKGALSSTRTKSITLEGLRKASQRKQQKAHLQTIRDDYNAITQMVRHAQKRPLLTHTHRYPQPHKYAHAHVHSTF